ncbi:MAG: hypothetical protein AAGF23_18145, partial [Acidobacteriota bacterium]
KRHLFGDLKVEIYDQDDNLLASLPGGKRKGLNRVDWPMRYKAPKLPAATNLVPAFVGPVVLEGTYKVKLVKGKDELWGSVDLVPDRRNPYSADERLAQQKASLELYDGLESLSFLIAQLESIRDLSAERSAGELRKRDKSQVEALGAKAEQLRTTLVSTGDAGWLSGDTKLREDMGGLYGAVTTYHGPPTGSQVEEMERLFAKLEKAASDVGKIAGAELDAVNATLEKRGLEPIPSLERGSWMAENSGKGASAAVFLSNKKGRQLLHQRLYSLWGAL